MQSVEVDLVSPVMFHTTGKDGTNVTIGSDAFWNDYITQAQWSQTYPPTLAAYDQGVYAYLYDDGNDSRYYYAPAVNTYIEQLVTGANQGANPATTAGDLTTFNQLVTGHETDVRNEVRTVWSPPAIVGDQSDLAEDLYGDYEARVNAFQSWLNAGENQAMAGMYKALARVLGDVGGYGRTIKWLNKQIIKLGGTP